MTDTSTSSSVPRELQVYVLSPTDPDLTVDDLDNDRSPRSFSPTRMREYHDLPDRVRRRAKHPLPDLVQAAREGKPIDMTASQPTYPGAPYADYCSYGSRKGFRIFSRRAADALHPLLAPAGTFLPLNCPEAELVGFVIDAVDDVMNTDAAQIDWAVGKNYRYMSSIQRYAFHTEKLGRFAIFRPAANGPDDPPVLQPLVDIVRSQRFTGFHFCRAWPAGEKKFWSHESWI